SVYRAERVTIARIRCAGVKLVTAARVARIGGGNAIVEELVSGTTRIVDSVDRIIMATARLPMDALEAELQGSGALGSMWSVMRSHRADFVRVRTKGTGSLGQSARADAP
ncbi:hypothetical protein, partial [Nocardioides sp. AN3]